MYAHFGFQNPPWLDHHGIQDFIGVPPRFRTLFGVGNLATNRLFKQMLLKNFPRKNPPVGELPYPVSSPCDLDPPSWSIH